MAAGSFMARRLIRGLLIAILSMILVACSPPSSGGGITIAQNDSTPPTLSLGAGQAGGQTTTVSAGGSDQTFALTSKTGLLNLLATAKDSESGIQIVQIWVNKTTLSCDANQKCDTSTDAPQNPRFESTSPKKNPGETTAESSVLAQTLDLSKEIDQGAVGSEETRRVELIIFAVAVNHLGGRTQTPKLTATWSEP